MSANAQHLSPAEAARRLGLSPKEIAILHQVVALKRLGLPLSRIAELLKRRLVALDALLAVQERTLAREGTRVERALALVRSARATLATGKTLSVDDLITLTRETTMTTRAQQ